MRVRAGGLVILWTELYHRDNIRPGERTSDQPRQNNNYVCTESSAKLRLLNFLSLFRDLQKPTRFSGGGGE